MKLHLLPLAVGIAATLMLSSCPETTVTRDFGAKPMKLDPADWNGHWRSAGDDSSFEMKVKEATKGTLTATFREKDAKTGKDKVDTFELVVREAGGDDKLCFLTHFDQPGAARGPLSLMTVPKKSVFILWHPDHDAVRAAVRKGELKGELVQDKEEKEKNREHSALSADPSNYKLLRQSRFWMWTEPETFERVK